MMKKKIFLLGILSAISIFSFALTPPGVVLKAFRTKFPNATNVKWEKESSHEYEASFMMHKAKYAANYSDKGKWLETETMLTFAKVPSEVQTAFTTGHPREKVKAASKLELAGGDVKYEIEVKKGAKTVEYFYTADGAVTVEK